MKTWMGVFGTLSFVLLALWVVEAGLGKTTMPGVHVQPQRKPRGYGNKWAVPVVSAANADDGLSYPRAPVM